MPDNPTLRRGDSGEWVTYLQQVLEYAGNSPGAADGDFGPRTDQAVRAFQQAHDLTVDGVVGPLTWAALATATDGGAQQAAQQRDQQAGQEAGGSNAGSGAAATEGSTGSIADWGNDISQWSQAQIDQFFTYNDVRDDADDLPAELGDAPEIQEATA